MNMNANDDDHFMKIHFVVVGGTVAAYANALALCRAGHSVTVLEVEDKYEVIWGPYGVVVPPNLSKLLVRWGMADELEKCGTISRKLNIVDYHSGESLGFHNWQQELLKDSGGEMMYVHLSDLKRMIRENAVSLGVLVRSGVVVSSVLVEEGARPSVRLASGEIVEADVIIGADGSQSFVRKEMLGQELHDTPLGSALFNVRIPIEKILADPELALLFDNKHHTTVWMGSRYSAWACTVGGECSLFVYTLDTGTEPFWHKRISNDDLLRFMSTCEPRLRNLAASASYVSCLPFTEPPQVECWVHPRGRVVLVGDAAHPFPRASTHGMALNVCDGGVLGTLFKHLHHDSQIDSFLGAYESIRRDRVKMVLQIEMMNVQLMALPAGEEKDARDRAFRERRDAGMDVFAPDSNNLSLKHWERDRMLFSYDAEEHAAEWWNDWGILQERADDAVLVPKEHIPVLRIDHKVEPAQPESL